ncbi:protein_phosphatase PP1 regulatory subunit sds22 [Hexamita inflata]|uniref:Protein phosphatase PP1 regulatory subunit sds22 n=1 Tax=Hexamita inflata TaxID=28002 RepID=A0AA86UUZ9_9EUKA|nr:protein phosphatase PP1 regulatory subunit sds22 [Hexamita inflata]
MQSSKLPSYEQKNTSDTNQLKATPFDNISEYDKQMIQKYQSLIEDGTLTIQQDPNLKSLNFINALKINQLLLYNCKNIVPQFESLTVKKLEIMYCEIQSVKGFQLENLEALKLNNTQNIIKSNTLVQEILRFQKLKELLLYQWEIHISPISQMTGLTKLNLIHCALRGTEALRSLINLEQLCLDDNEDIDITTVQYLINLTILQLESCNLVSLDVLRPLKKLKELYIFNNKIVYLLPLMKLKQLSQFDAGFNKIIDIESIQLHPNFDNFMIADQKQPTKEELEVANMMRDINNQITFLEQMNKKSSRIEEINTVFRQKINQQLQQSCNSHERFLTRAIYLFKKLSSFDNCQ